MERTAFDEAHGPDSDLTPSYREAVMKPLRIQVCVSVDEGQTSVPKQTSNRPEGVPSDSNGVSPSPVPSFPLSTMLFRAAACSRAVRKLVGYVRPPIQKT